jgi:hypothetical protein
MLLLSIISTIILSSLSIFWTVIIIPFIFFGYSFYNINDSNVITCISKNIKHSTIRDEDHEPYGLFIGYYYIGYISQRINKDTPGILYCLATQQTLKELSKKQYIDTEENKYFISLITLRGNYYCRQPRKRDLECSRYIPKENQVQVIDETINYYNENHVCVTMIYGLPGTGKSIVGLLIAKKLKGSFCKTYDPTIAGDTLEYIYDKAQVKKNSPLIILIDEFDVILERLHNNKITMHADIPTEVYNKTSWNTLLDDINIKLYPYVIIILTSNLSKDDIDSRYDPSYIRNGRVNIYHNLHPSRV